MLKNRILMTVTALGIGLGLGWTLAAQEGPQWKDRAEYDLFEAARTDANAKSRVGKLDEWKSKYPDTAFVDLREDSYLITYQQVPDNRKAFDMAAQIRTRRPNHGLAINAILTLVYTFTPPAAADLTAAEQTAKHVLDNADQVFTAANAPSTMTPDQWVGAKSAVLNLAQRTYAWVFIQRQDNAASEREIKKFLSMDGSQAQFSYYLAQAIQKQDPQGRVPEALFHFVRAGNYAGQNAIPDAQRGQVKTYSQTLYKQYTGLDTGYDQLVAIATNNTFPPANFALESATARAQRELAAQQAWEAANPDWSMWNDIILANLKATPGFFKDVMEGALMPGAAGQGKFSKFRATVISAEPADRPTKLVVAVGDPTKIDAKIGTVTINIPEKLPAGVTVAPGSMIQFEGVAKTYTESPFMLTFESEPAQVVPIN